MILSKESSSWKVQNSLNFLDRNGGGWHDDSLWSQLTTPRPCNDIGLTRAGQLI